MEIDDAPSGATPDNVAAAFARARPGSIIPEFSGSLIAKLITGGTTREEAIRRRLGQQ